MAARERLVDMATTYAERRCAIRLHFGTDRLGTDRQQSRPRQVKQNTGIVICIDESILVDVENDDCLGCVLDECAIAFFVLPQRDLGLPCAVSRRAG